MSTINYISLCKSQRKEITTSRSQYEESQIVYPIRKKDPILAAAELRSQRRDYRSNMCGSCFASRSANGSCNCE